MKKWICVTMIAVPTMLVANTQIDQLLDQEVTKQSYHETGTLAKPAQTRTTQAVPTAKMRRVAADSVRAKPKGQSKEAVFSHTVARVFAEKQVDLEKAIQSVRDEQSSNMEEIFKLKQALLQAEAQTKRLISIMKAMNQQISTEKQTGVTAWVRAQYAQLFQWFQGMVGHVGAWVCTVVVTLIVLWLVLRLIGCCCGCGRRCPCVKRGCSNEAGCAPVPADRAEAHADTDSEYDFMGSKEGVSAKLDLGRAYIEMEDYHAARKVLQEVIQHGEAEQQMEAQGLIDEMPPEDE